MIDSRELIEEADNLRLEMEEAREEGKDPDPTAVARLERIDALADEIGSEWDYGAALIEEGEFEDHARELAEDIGAIDREAGWPNTCIDWEKAADELKMDYTVIEFEGETYYVRA